MDGGSVRYDFSQTQEDVIMKKIIALLLCLVLAAVSVAVFAEGESDKDYVIGKGKLIVGITDFEPMDFKDENGVML